MDWLKRFVFTDDSFVVIANGHASRVEYHPANNLPKDLEGRDDVFFGPALRKTQGNAKDDVLGTQWLWVDVDNITYPQLTYPPSLVVHSGHGFHLYWRLTEPILNINTIEQYNKVLAGDIPTADQGSWNANRVLRVPATTNTKPPSGRVQLRREYPHTYSPEAFAVLGRLDKKAKHKIRTGDRRGYRSRSERDWAVINSLLEADADEDLVRFLFEHQPVGDKVNDPTTPDTYLDKSIQEAKRRTSIRVRRDVDERGDGYYDLSKRGARRISTFTIDPRLLLDATGSGGEDAILGNVRASGHIWEGITFTRSAFTGVGRLDKACPVAAWQWLGRDDDVRRLLPHLLDKLTEKGMPRVIATPILGLHQHKQTWHFVTDKQTFSADEVWSDYDGPIAALPSLKERPRFTTHGVLDEDRRRAIRDAVAVLTPIESRSVLIGWYFASPLKVYFEAQGYRFPILNVTGTRGAGKTTLIQRVFMPLLGQDDPRSYDSGTTRFVTLALLGGTNAIPIAFSEFRYASVPNFIRYILLAYDTGHDPRGRSDQTTVDYPLLAPFSVDGEDMIADPAAQERMVVAQLHPNDISEGSPAYEAFEAFEQMDLTGFGTTYIQYLLDLLQQNKIAPLIDAVRAQSFEEIPQRLPDRIRNNHIVAQVGCTLYCQFTQQDAPPFIELSPSLNRVFDLQAGRGRTMVDSFVEAVVDASTSWTATFTWTTADGGKVYYFQLASAHDWWLTARRRQGRVGLERDAILSQLKEAEYYVEPKVINDTFMYGINLPEAQAAGLDVTKSIRSKT